MELKGGKLKPDKRKCIFKQWEKVMGLISTRKLAKSGVSQCSERLDIYMANKSIQRSCQWGVIFQMFLFNVIFLELGSPRWRCNWNFGKVPAWSGLCSCLLNIQFYSSPCQSLKRSRTPGKEGWVMCQPALRFIWDSRASTRQTSVQELHSWALRWHIFLFKCRKLFQKCRTQG